MAALSWLLIPLTAAVAASLWGSWAARRNSSTPDAVGVAGYERFRAAMERTRGEAEEYPEAVARDASTAQQSETDRTAAAPVAGSAAVPDGPGRTAD